MEKKAQHTSSIFSWAVVILLVFFILVKGFWVYFMIGDRGQPDWNYHPVKDVPGQSPYAIYEKPPYPQHVRGAGGE